MRKNNIKKKKENYTSLVGVKWTQSSLEMCLVAMYKRYQNKLMKNTKMSDDEKMKRLCNLSVIFSSIYCPVKKYGVTVKKK